MKKCRKCGEKKKLNTEYYHNKKSKDGYASLCKSCAAKEHREWHQRPYVKELRRASRLRQSERQRVYYQENKQRIREYERERRKRDIHYVLRNRMRLRMWKLLRNNKSSNKWQTLVGYSVSELREHIEKQFHDGMTWERFMNGEIHIDHIIPLSAFNISSYDCIDFRRCWSLNNLRPMWAIDNIRKGGKLDRPFQPSLSIDRGGSILQEPEI